MKWSEFKQKTGVEKLHAEIDNDFEIKDMGIDMIEI